MRVELKSILVFLILLGFTGVNPMLSQRIQVGTVGSLKATAFDSRSEVLYAVFQDSVVIQSIRSTSDRRTKSYTLDISVFNANT